ncbi:MAG: hypothetical protein QXD77_00500 [Candidatus Aenigmatarchaeota archaeon]
MTMIRKVIGTAAVTIMFSVMISGIALAGAGLSPASLEFYNMVRGGYAEKYLTISNPGSDDVEVTVSAEGDMAEFLTFYPNRFNLSAGNYMMVKVNATPPIDMANGVYRGTIFVVSRPVLEGENQGSNLMVASGVSAAITIVVTDVETKDYAVEWVSVSDTEECRDIVVTMSIRNTGNVRVTPKANIRITSEDGSKLLQNYDFTGKVMLPTTLSTYIIRIPYSMEQYRCIPAGKYKITADFYLDDRAMETRYAGLTIFERGVLSVSGELMELYSSQSDITLGDTLKIDGLFKNTGQLPVKSKLKIEAYQNDRLIDTTEGEEIEIGTGGLENVTAYYKPSAAGNILLRGRVLYEGKLSNIKEISVNVSYPTVFFIAMAVGAIIIIAVAIFLLKRKGSKKRPRRR